MMSKAVIDEAVRRIVAVARPDKIVVFGSQARGDVHPRSDLEVLVIRDSSEPRYLRSAPLYTALADLPAEIEVFVYTPAEVAEWANVRPALVITALREGEVVYERAA